jgi:hypothetical protein
MAVAAAVALVVMAVLGERGVLAEQAGDAAGDRDAQARRGAGQDRTAREPGRLLLGRRGPERIRQNAHSTVRMAE